MERNNKEQENLGSIVVLVVDGFNTDIYCDKESAIKAAKDVELEEGSFSVVTLTEEELLNYMVEAYEVSDEEDLIKTVDAIRPHIDSFKDEDIRMLYGEILEIVDVEECEEFLLSQIIK